ncbi:MAG TPA: Hint domain-containing protein [Acetobacteraceae bacterium]
MTPDVDVAMLSSILSGSSSYTVTVATGTAFDISQLQIGRTGDGAAPALAIDGTLKTDTLSYISTSNTPTVLNINPGGLFDIRTSILDSGSHIETLAISGMNAGGHLELGSLSVVNASVHASFQNAGIGVVNTGVIEYLSGFQPGSSTSQVISNVAWGDSFIIDGADFTGDTATLTGTTLTVKNGDTTVFTMNNVTEQHNANARFAVHGDVISAVCYARGTLIRTPDGDLPVERLRPGRQVTTLVDGEPVVRQVRWLGHRRIDLTSHHRPETVAPIRIQRGAFADELPRRDLLVSPDHAILVEGTLICARQLVNGTTIRQEAGWTAVDYYHVELDRHAILLAEGLPAESYIDTGNSGFFANSGAPLVLHPDLTDEAGYPTREAGSCAPFVWDEASVRPVWQRLAERAAAIGRPVPQPATTADAGLRLLAKGRSVRPIYGDDDLVIFTLPRGAREVRLVSRAASPTDARPWLEDRRRLGVRVARIVLRGADEVREVPVDHPDLAGGWWAVERDGQAISRWTDGEAVLPLPAMRGDIMLELHLAGAMTYVEETARAA